MRYIVLLALFFIVSACTDYTYIMPEDYSGITLNSHRGVHKVFIKIQGEATCATQIKFYLSGEPWIVPVNNSVDTVLTMDWYGEPLEFRAEIDSCFVKAPSIGIKFID